MNATQTIAASSLRTVESVLQAFCDTWNRHDMDAMSELFTLDADFVNVIGMHFKSRAELATAHAELHKHRFAKSEVRLLQHEVKYLTEDIALAHMTWKMTGDLSSSLRRGVMTHVLVRKDDRWYFRATQNTDIVFVAELSGHPFWSQYM